VASKKISDQQVQGYLERLMQSGADNFVASVVEVGYNRYPSTRTPDLECLDIAEGFFSLYRRSGEEIHFTLGKLLRKSAHIINRRIEKLHRRDGQSNRFIRALDK
jgi:hypothetical protein